MSLLQILDELIGPAPKTPKFTIEERLGFTSIAVPEEEKLADTISRGIRKPPIGDSKDLQRILALPRRAQGSFDTPTQNEKSLRRIDSTVALFPIQRAALENAYENNGLFAPIGVGGGKTLVTLLLPMVLQSKVSVLLIPPSMKAQLLERDYVWWNSQFILPNLAGGRFFVPGLPLLHVLAYSELSQPAATSRLAQLSPDLIIADEAHNLRSRGAARTKRFLRYLSENPTTRFCALSGTLTANSIKDYAHLAQHSLKEKSPVPLNFGTVLEWSTAIDPAPVRAPIGKLADFCEPGEDIRSGFRRRMVETPGVVATSESSLGTSLVIDVVPVHSIPSSVKEAIHEVKRNEERPDGEILFDQLTMSKCLRELSYGFYLRWVYPRGESRQLIDQWFEIRRNWFKELRDRLKYSKEHLDSPKLCIDAALRYESGYKGELPIWKTEHFNQWMKIKDLVQPETQSVWIDPFLAEISAHWALAHKGIVWYLYNDFGRRVAEIGKLPFYGPGKDASLQILGETGKRSIVASINAHGTGKNLQMFERNLVANMPANGGRWEQLLGRTHRPGQKADEIIAYIFQHTEVLKDSFDRSLDLAQYIKETFGSEQKLLFATKTFAENKSRIIENREYLASEYEQYQNNEKEY